MLKKTVIAIGVVGAIIVAILVYAGFRTDTCRISRSIVINAPADRIYPFMSDFHKGLLWSPYETKDPAMKRTFSGAMSGKGAVYEFAGDVNKVGSGRLEIIEALPPTRVVLTLDMIEPMKAHNKVDYILEPRGDRTRVTWSMSGESDYPGKLISLFIDVDTMVGKDFESGLANLKTLLERNN